MGTNLLPLRPAVIRLCATSDAHRADANRRKTSSVPSPNWWSPLFGWSSEPDYIATEAKQEEFLDKRQSRDSDSETKPVRPRFAPGAFTDEKARQLRMLTTETASFHYAMYHSAIAARLASDFKSRSDR
ncbi:hypothetical protein K2173_016554 [Erythroxylum novogranatense]|uniref:Uncharacterized protein n=1 Tax=Erythroxylum novogranatense TaxID=1862640 RepID=A0AAV8SGP1_9ROSI|nr:hypothetical protein K2173_016554 [Erythroxylum novogranatense]